MLQDFCAFMHGLRGVCWLVRKELPKLANRKPFDRLIRRPSQTRLIKTQHANPFLIVRTVGKVGGNETDAQGDHFG